MKEKIRPNPPRKFFSPNVNFQNCKNDARVRRKKSLSVLFQLLYSLSNVVSAKSMKCGEKEGFVLAVNFEYAKSNKFLIVGERRKNFKNE